MSGSLDLAEEALRATSGDDAEVVVHAERSGVARFAASIVHQPTLIENSVVRVRVLRDGKIGWAATNRVDAEGLAAVARRASEAADSARPDPDFPGFAGPASYSEVEGYDEETAALGAADQARLAAAAIEAAGDIGLYGIYTSGVTEIAVASSTGVAAEQTTTDAVCLCLAADKEASGWAERTGWRAADVDPAEPAREAAATAARTRGGGELEPGTYRAVLEPVAVGDLVRWFSYDSMGAQGFLEERSYFCGRIGEHAFDPKVSIADNALDSANLPRPFDFEGTPKQRVPLIEEGVIRGPVWDRATAARAGRASTGHGLPAGTRSFGAVPTNLALAPGEAESTDELAELVGDGIHVTRLHYLSVVNPRDGVITGMTRDGTFRIRGGKVAEPLGNLRFTIAVPDVLRDVLGLTRETTLVNQSDFYDERWAYGNRVPALATADFNVTGVGGGPGL